MCCNPTNGRVDFENGWLIKSSFITTDEHEACQLTRTKAQKQKQNIFCKLKHEIGIKTFLQRLKLLRTQDYFSANKSIKPK
jgi:hypothetical protein